jgi:hypothetical protein
MRRLCAFTPAALSTHALEKSSVLSQDSSKFPQKMYKPSQNHTFQKADMNQIPYRRSQKYDAPQTKQNLVAQQMTSGVCSPLPFALN